MIASSGTYFASIFEWSGYFYQSFFLDQFHNSLLSSIAQFVYILGILYAMFNIVMRGEFKLAAWFILLPGLFISVIFVRSDNATVEWRFGSLPRDTDAVNERVRQSLYNNGYEDAELYKPRPSALFHAYNKLISHMMTSLVSVLNYERENVDQSFLVKAELFAHMSFPIYSREGSTQGFRQLLHVGLLHKCGDLIDSADKMMDVGKFRFDRCRAAVKYADRLSETVSLGKEALQFVYELGDRYPEIFSPSVYGKSEKFGSLILEPTCMMQKTFNSCASNAGDSGARYADTIDDIDLTECSAGASDLTAKIFARYCEADKEAQEASLADIQKWRNIVISENKFTCAQIWNYIYVALGEESSRVLIDGAGLIIDPSDNPTNARSKKEHTCTEVIDMMNDSDRVSEPERRENSRKIKEFLDSYTRFSGFESPTDIVQHISRKLFKVESTNNSAISLAAEYSRRSELFDEIGIAQGREVTRVERARVTLREWQERTKVMMAASTLPHYQGMILCCLSIAFLFFPICLLYPGKHGGFILWFALWFWVKSWDPMFACVMLLDDTFSSLFIAEHASKMDVSNRGLPDDLGIAVQALKAVDPTMNIATRYNIVGVILLMIPGVSLYISNKLFLGTVGIISAGAQLQALERSVGGSGRSAFGSSGGLADAATKVASQDRVGALTQSLYDTRLAGSIAQARSYSSGITGIGTAGIGRSIDPAQAEKVSGFRSASYRSKPYLVADYKTALDKWQKSEPEAAFYTGIEEGLDGNDPTGRRTRGSRHRAADAAGAQGRVDRLGGGSNHVNSSRQGWLGGRIVDTAVKGGASWHTWQSETYRTSWQQRMELARRYHQYDKTFSLGVIVGRLARESNSMELPFIMDGVYDEELKAQLANLGREYDKMEYILEALLVAFGEKDRDSS